MTRPARLRRSPRRWLPGLLAAGVLVAATGACTSDPGPVDPEAALVQTVEGTLEGAFAYRLEAEADREALAALGRSLGTVAARLNLFEVTGVVDGPVVSVDISAFGTEPLFQLRRFDDDAVTVRIAAGDGPLAAVATPELEGRLLGMAVQTAQPQSVVEAIGALFDGAWVAVTGDFDPSALTALGGDGPTPGTRSEDARTGRRPPLPDLVADYLTITDQVEDDGATTVRVDLRVQALLRALATLDRSQAPDAGFEEGLALLPATVTGDVVTRDGVVERIVFDVAAGAREAGEDVPGSLQLRLVLSDHGDPDRPELPEALVTVPSAELTAGLGQLLATPPKASESASPAAP